MNTDIKNVYIVVTDNNQTPEKDDSCMTTNIVNNMLEKDQQINERTPEEDEQIKINDSQLTSHLIIVRKDESEDQTQELVKTPHVTTVKQFNVDQQEQLNKLHLNTPQNEPSHSTKENEYKSKKRLIDKNVNFKTGQTTEYGNVELGASFIKDGKANVRSTEISVERIPKQVKTEEKLLTKDQSPQTGDIQLLLSHTDSVSREIRGFDTSLKNLKIKIQGGKSIKEIGKLERMAVSNSDNFAILDFPGQINELSHENKDGTLSYSPLTQKRLPPIKTNIDQIIKERFSPKREKADVTAILNKSHSDQSSDDNNQKYTYYSTYQNPNQAKNKMLTTHISSERALISNVKHNDLQKKMKMIANQKFMANQKPQASVYPVNSSQYQHHLNQFNNNQNGAHLMNGLVTSQGISLHQKEVNREKYVRNQKKRQKTVQPQRGSPYKLDVNFQHEDERPDIKATDQSVFNKTGFSTSVIDLSNILTKNSPSNFDLIGDSQVQNNSSKGIIQVSIVSPNQPIQHHEISAEEMSSIKIGLGELINSRANSNQNSEELTPDDTGYSYEELPTQLQAATQKGPFQTLPNQGGTTTFLILQQQNKPNKVVNAPARSPKQIKKKVTAQTIHQLQNIQKNASDFQTMASQAMKVLKVPVKQKGVIISPDRSSPQATTTFQGQSSFGMITNMPNTEMKPIMYNNDLPRSNQNSSMHEDSTSPRQQKDESKKPSPRRRKKGKSKRKKQIKKHMSLKVWEQQAEKSGSRDSLINRRKLSTYNIQNQSRTRITDKLGYATRGDNGSSVMLLNASRSMQNSDLGIEKLETERLLANHQQFQAPLATQGSSLSPAFVNEVDSSDNILRVTSNSKQNHGNQPFQLTTTLRRSQQKLKKLVISPKITNVTAMSNKKPILQSKGQKIDVSPGLEKEKMSPKYLKKKMLQSPLQVISNQLTPSQTVAEIEKSLDRELNSTHMIKNNRTPTREKNGKNNVKGSPRPERVPYNISKVEIGEYPSQESLQNRIRNVQEHHSPGQAPDTQSFEELGDDHYRRENVSTQKMHYSKVGGNKGVSTPPANNQPFNKTAYPPMKKNFGVESQGEYEFKTTLDNYNDHNAIKIQDLIPDQNFERRNHLNVESNSNVSSDQANSPNEEDLTILMGQDQNDRIEELKKITDNVNRLVISNSKTTEIPSQFISSTTSKRIWKQKRSKKRKQEKVKMSPKEQYFNQLANSSVTSTTNKLENYSSDIQQNIFAATLTSMKIPEFNNQLKPKKVLRNDSAKKILSDQSSPIKEKKLESPEAANDKPQQQQATNHLVNVGNSYKMRSQTIRLRDKRNTTEMVKNSNLRLDMKTINEQTFDKKSKSDESEIGESAPISPERKSFHQQTSFGALGLQSQRQIDTKRLQSKYTTNSKSSKPTIGNTAVKQQVHQYHQVINQVDQMAPIKNEDGSLQTLQHLMSPKQTSENNAAYPSIGMYLETIDGTTEMLNTPTPFYSQPYQGINIQPQKVKLKQGEREESNPRPQFQSLEQAEEMTVPFPKNLDRMALKYQFTSVNRMNHLDNFQRNKMLQRIQLQKKQLFDWQKNYDGSQEDILRLLIKAQEERYLPNREKVNQEYKNLRSYERKGNNRNRSTFQSSNDRDQGNQEKIKMPHIRCKSNLVSSNFRDKSPIHMNRTQNIPSLMMTYEGFKQDFNSKKLTLQDVQPVTKNTQIMNMTSKTQNHSPMNQFASYLPYINVDLQDFTQKNNGSPQQSKTPDSFSEDPTDGFKTAHVLNHFGTKDHVYKNNEQDQQPTELSLQRERENNSPQRANTNLDQSQNQERDEASLSKMTVKVDKVVVNDKSRDEYSKQIRNIALENQEVLQSLNNNSIETDPTQKNLGLHQQSSFHSQITNDIPIPRLNDVANGLPSATHQPRYPPFDILDFITSPRSQVKIYQQLNHKGQRKTNLSSKSSQLNERNKMNMQRNVDQIVKILDDSIMNPVEQQQNQILYSKDARPVQQSGQMIIKSEMKIQEEESHKLPNISMILKNKEMTAMNMLKLQHGQIHQQRNRKSDISMGSKKSKTVEFEAKSIKHLKKNKLLY